MRNGFIEQTNVPGVAAKGKGRRAPCSARRRCERKREKSNLLCQASLRKEKGEEYPALPGVAAKGVGE
jgi:hypothetical protein